MKFISSIPLCLLLLLALPGANAQNVTNHEVEPTGVYKEISANIKGDFNVAALLSDTLNMDKTKLIDSVKRNANHFIPPVLYILSAVLYRDHKYSEAAYWFYVAQLRARYDVNRCTDKTASAGAFNENFGPPINEYAFKNLDTLQTIITNVVAYVRANQELYEQRWINLEGMQAMTEGLGGKSSDQPLSADKKEWEAIKKKTIDSYFSDFKEALARQKKAH
ncbi:MAG TPA: hypothetical protein VFE53_25770 [Mucilaginibacter sp.]|jgi:hypothetical protein|nr:hypothetical protein [Mucilaginibacter sp.]